FFFSFLLSFPSFFSFILFSLLFCIQKSFHYRKKKNYTQNVSPQTTAQPASTDVKKESAVARLLGSGMCALLSRCFCAIEIVLLTLGFARYRWCRRIDGLSSCMTTTRTHPLNSRF